MTPTERMHEQARETAFTAALRADADAAAWDAWVEQAFGPDLNDTKGEA